MAKIVIDARIINSSTGRYVERLLTYLQDLDNDNKYVVLVPKKDLDYWTPKNTNFSIVECNYKNYSFAEQTVFAWQLYRLKADLVHFCMPQQPLLYFKKHVTTMYDLILLRSVSSDKNYFYFKFKQLIGWFVFWIVGRSSRYILAITDYTKDDYSRTFGVKPSKVVTTTLAADIVPRSPKKVYVGFDSYIMYLGRQGDHKNIKRLILAHQLLLKKYPNLGLVLVGSKNELVRMNERWVNENNYKNVVFTGFLSDEESAWLYSNAEAYVFPSLMEGFGLPGLEAMIGGAPVVSSNSTCLPEVYGDAALYFDPTDVDEIASSVEKIMEDPKLKKSLIEKGHKRVKLFSWKKMAQETLDVYRKALKE